MSKHTINALIGRGIDSEKAQLLASKYTLFQLQKLTNEKLLSLGLSNDNINSILDTNSRPPIPSKTIKQLLFKSKFTCCVCRDKNQPVVIHHIEEWHKSKNHSEENLVVLCPNHHDKAHQRGGLSLELTPKRLKEIKNEWENLCQKEDAYYLLTLSQGQNSRWDWFHIQRMHELYKKQKINLSQNDSFCILQDKNLLDLDGYINLSKIKELARESHFTDWGDGFHVYHYLTDIIDCILNNIKFIDITSILKDKGILEKLVNQGDYIGFQGRFYFKQLEDGKLKKAYYRISGVRIYFVYDPYFCTSCSSKHCSMTGNKVITVIGRVLSVSKDEDSVLHIELSCLATGSGFLNHLSRELDYIPQDSSEFNEIVLNDVW